MAKMTYENDNGEQTSVEFSKKLVSELESLHNVDGLDEIVGVFKSLIKSQTEENEHQAD